MAEIAQQVEWINTEAGLKPFVVTPHSKTEAIWAPQPGSQEAFMECPVFECLYTGTRGPGKTDALLMDFAQDVGKGWGSDWRGILFRKTYPELADVIEKSKKWFPRIWPGASFNEAKTIWKWPTGETLLFRHFSKVDDYWHYHGHAYPWIAWEELTTWADDQCYKRMFSCARSTAVGMPIKVRATTNPYGVGHNWVKARYRLPIPHNRMVGDVLKNVRDREGNIEPPRVAIHGDLAENQILLTANPDYIQRLRAAARNPSEKKAWEFGSWDIVAGGMFDDLWEPKWHVAPNFPFKKIPKGWRLNRSYDHGQSKPFSVGWWAESNGETFRHLGRTYGAVPGDLIRIAEWYGWSGKANEGIRMLSKNIARGILDREDDMGIRGRVKIGPADNSIFDDFEEGKSVAGDMATVGVRWERVDKGQGSRKQGWEQLRKLLAQALPVRNGIREQPGIFVCERCEQFMRTFPVLPRSDKDLDDVDTDAEDHIGDEIRYRCRERIKAVKQRDF